MNILVKNLGLGSLVFFNESGLDVDLNNAGAYGSARDIAHLFAYAILARPRVLEATTFDRFTSVSTTGLRYDAVNTNKIVNQIPGIMGSKTGFTDLAGGNLAVVFDSSIGHPVVVVVLGSTVDGRFDDVMRLVNASI
jgi:D-alanyl-D-alanine carboxypeptidase (penicillin-binding protein 5/6)